MQVGCSPTPFSVTRGVVGLIAGPSKASRRLNYWVRFICPLQPVVAATDLRTRLGRGSEPFTSKPSGTGRPPLLAVRWPVPRVSPLTPQVTFSFTWQRYSFLYRHRVGWFSRPLSWARGHPDGNPSFVPPFRGFRLAGRFRPIFVPRRADTAVGNKYPPGNCVQCVLETCPHLLDSVLRFPKVAQTGLVLRSLPPSPKGAQCELSGVLPHIGLTHRGVPDARQCLPASSGRFLAGLAPVCFAPNLLSGFIAFDGVRPPSSHSSELCLIHVRFPVIPTCTLDCRSSFPA